MARKAVLIKCSQGVGMVYRDDDREGEKLKVHLVDDNCEPIKDENGKEKRILVHPDEVTVYGFID